MSLSQYNGFLTRFAPPGPDRTIRNWLGRLQVSLRRLIMRNALLFLLYSVATFGATGVYGAFAAFAAAQSEPGLTRFGCNVSIFS